MKDALLVNKVVDRIYNFTYCASCKSEMQQQSKGIARMTNESPATIAKPEDLDRDLAYRAHANTSFVPEQRATQAQQEYADDVNGLHAEMLKLAVSEQQKALLADEIERYRKGYLERYTAYLHSHSRCASSAITGPANFPVRQQQKRSQWADNKRDEFLQWRERARAAIKRNLLEARTPEEKDDANWQELRRDITRSLDTIREIDEENSPYTRSAFVNSIAGKVERLALNGEATLVDKALELVREYNAGHKKPAISERHAFWTFGDLAKQRAAAHDAAADSEPSTILEGKGIRIVENKAADRVQIFFPGKPDEETRTKLKGEGWRWSPSEEAWQRKLTNAAIYSAKKLTGLQ